MFKQIFRTIYTLVIAALAAFIAFTSGYELGYDDGRISVAFDIRIKGKTPEDICMETPSCCDQIVWCKEKRENEQK